METKLIEIRDHGTCFVALCTRIWPIVGAALGGKERVQRMAWRCGFRDSMAVIFTHLGEPSRTQVDPFAWGDRTLHVAHRFIEENWHMIPGGGLVDVRVVLKETDTPAPSEFSDDPIL